MARGKTRGYCQTRVELLLQFNHVRQLLWLMNSRVALPSIRVQPREAALKMIPQRQGTVVGFGVGPTSVRVIWDGLKCPQTVSWSYIEPVQDDH